MGWSSAVISALNRYVASSPTTNYSTVPLCFPSDTVKCTKKQEKRRHENFTANKNSNQIENCRHIFFYRGMHDGFYNISPQLNAFTTVSVDIVAVIVAEIYRGR